MKFYAISDLHINHYFPATLAIPEELDNGDGEKICLIIAGDIADSFTPLIRTIEELEASPLDVLASRFDHVVLVPGNHDHLDFPLGEWVRKVRDFCSEHGYDNVHVLNNDTTTIEGVKIVGTTLWSRLRFNHVTRFRAERTMVEYLYGWNSDDKKLTTYDTNREWQKSIGYLWAAGGRDFYDQKLIWVTHHPMFKESIHPNFEGCDLNDCYVAETEEAYLAQERHKPDFILHGHTHSNFDYTINGSRVLCHPSGYPHQTENGFPKPLLFLETSSVDSR